MDPLAAKMIAASTGATVTALTMTPFDVVKTRMQTQPTPLLFPRPPALRCCQPSPADCVRNMSSLARPPVAQELVCLWEGGHLKSERVNGFWDAVIKVWRTEGSRGLWKGAGTSLAMGAPLATAYMITYDHLLRVVIPTISPLPALTPLIAGVTARATVSTVASPLELLRTNLQATPVSPSQVQTFRSVISDLNGLVRTQGFHSLWRGVGPTLWRDVPFSGLYWANYEWWKKFMESRGHRGSWVAFTSGAFSGTIAAIVTSPFDVLKTRRQALLMSTSLGGDRSKSTRSLAILSKILRTEGANALFAGLSPRIAKIAPACGIMIACFEGVGAFLAKSPNED